MKILIATDGSEYSRAAIDECCRMFENATNAEIEIISVYEMMIPPTEPFAVTAEYVQQVDGESRAKASDVAEKAQAQIREKCPALADKTNLKVVSGAPAPQIVEEAANWGADLIISGSHGYGFWKRAWLGSVSNALVHNSPCSVLIVRAQHAAQGAAGI
jgi:nucleotide-binding universal stress UspA family protein